MNKNGSILRSYTSSVFFLPGRLHPVAFARVENLDVGLCLLKVFDDFWMIVVQNGDLLNVLVGK